MSNYESVKSNTDYYTFVNGENGGGRKRSTRGAVSRNIMNDIQQEMDKEILQSLKTNRSKQHVFQDLMNIPLRKSSDCPSYMIEIYNNMLRSTSREDILEVYGTMQLFGLNAFGIGTIHTDLTDIQSRECLFMSPVQAQFHSDKAAEYMKVLSDKFKVEHVDGVEWEVEIMCDIPTSKDDISIKAMKFIDFDNVPAYIKWTYSALILPNSKPRTLIIVCKDWFKYLYSQMRKDIVKMREYLACRWLAFISTLFKDTISKGSLIYYNRPKGKSNNQYEMISNYYSDAFNDYMFQLYDYCEPEMILFKDMVENIKQFYKKVFMNSSVLTPELINIYIKKVDSVVVISHPLDNLKVRCDMPDIEICDYFDTLIISGYQRQIKHMYGMMGTRNYYKKGGVKHNIFNVWNYVRMNVANAFFLKDRNMVVIPYGLLMRPEFIESKSIEELYAWLGVIIGHEIGHAFDTTGRLIDGCYQMIDFTKSEKKEFEQFDKNFNKLMSIKDVKLVGPIPFRMDNSRDELLSDMLSIDVISKGFEENCDFNMKTFFHEFAKYQWEINDNIDIDITLHPLNIMRVNIPLVINHIFASTYNLNIDDCMYKPLQLW